MSHVVNDRTDHVITTAHRIYSFVSNPWIFRPHFLPVLLLTRQRCQEAHSSDCFCPHVVVDDRLDLCASRWLTDEFAVWTDIGHCRWLDFVVFMHFSSIFRSSLPSLRSNTSCSKRQRSFRNLRSFFLSWRKYMNAQYLEINWANFIESRYRR